MKRFLTILLAFILLLSISCIAFADGDTIRVSETTDTVTATYTKSETYTVSIPASVNIGGSLNITANTNNILSSNCLKLNIKTSNSDDGATSLIATNTADSKYSIGYYIVDSNGYRINNNASIPIPSGGEKIIVSYGFKLEDDQTIYPGTYEDILNFAFSVVPSF